MEEKAFSEKLNAARLEKIAGFTLFDDTFMSTVFAAAPECAEYVLSVILGKSLKVTEARAQFEVRNLLGSSARLDIMAEDSEKNVYNIEVQRESSGAKPRRARRNGSLLDCGCKDMGAYGEKLPETYVIFITEKDYWKRGEPVYSFERTCLASKGEPLDFGDGLHIIYVNGEYKGNDEIGNLMHDFSCANPDEMKSRVLKDTASRFKKNQKEVIDMCQAMEELNQMVIEHAMEKTAMEAIRMGLSLDQIQRLTEFSTEKIHELQMELEPAMA